MKNLSAKERVALLTKQELRESVILIGNPKLTELLCCERSEKRDTLEAIFLVKAPYVQDCFTEMYWEMRIALLDRVAELVESDEWF